MQMLKSLFQRIIKLIDVKSIITFALCYGFLWLTFRGQIKAEIFTTIFNTCISFYFGTQAMKNKTD